MSFFKKLFSSSYRKAVAYEGAGRYREAAEQYMLSGERTHVARMHRLVARDEQDPYARVQSLRKALDLLPDYDEAEDTEFTRQAIRADLAEAIVEQVEHVGVLDRRDKTALEEAARIFTEMGELNRAGEVMVKLGYLNRAAELFKQAGNIQRMEEMFRRVETVDLATAEFDRAWDAYEFASTAGDHVGALEALERCVELKAHDAGLTARLQVLRQRMPVCGRLSLRNGQGDVWNVVGGATIGIGREDDNEVLLPSAGVSRRHARLSLRGGHPALEDLGSRHGTSIQTRPVSASARLAERGRFRIGKDVEVEYAFRAGLMLPMQLNVVDGYLKGYRFIWAQELVTTGIPPEEPEWLPGGLALRFMRGYWHVVPEACAGPVRVGGEQVTAPTLLRAKDEIGFDGVVLRVV